MIVAIIVAMIAMIARKVMRVRATKNLHNAK